MTDKKLPSDFDTRPLEWWEISRLKQQGCTAASWESIEIEDGTDISKITDVAFGSNIKIGAGATLRHIPGCLINCRIGRNAIVENVARIEFDHEAPCGVGTTVCTLDETGSRPVTIYPGLSAQVATLMARVPRWYEENIHPTIHDFLDSRSVGQEIGEGAVVRDCGRIINVSIGAGASVIGARSLVNGAVINNAVTGRALAYIGNGVDAENFIIEDGRVDSGAIIRNCYVGQGACIEKGFSAHDSLFFANCTFENGEACALLAGPYSVSMHKGTLMIGCQTAFMNAGSSTNQSNHMYKLGPVNWGVLERGVKTSSGAYIMFGAKIGAFSMIMGAHKTHPDSSDFPFSYLFGDERGATVVVPGAMLRSCGLMRDEQKWPTRDRRQKRRLPYHDRITFSVLSPFTVDKMLNAIDTISSLLSQPADDDLYLRHKGMKFTRAALERAKNLYTAAIFKYLSMSLPTPEIPDSDGEAPEDWVDVGGQIVTRDCLDEALAATSLTEVERIFSEAENQYPHLQQRWIGRRFGKWWREHQNRIPFGAEQFDELVADDRKEYLDTLSREIRMLEL